MIKVEVVYGTAHEQCLVPLSMSPESTVADAIQQSGILNVFSDIDFTQQKVGIFSRMCTLDKRLRDGDRVEIYRPLLADPKDRRRQRVQLARDEKTKSR